MITNFKLYEKNDSEIVFYTIDDNDYNSNYVTNKDDIMDMIELYLYEKGEKFSYISKLQKYTSDQYIVWVDGTSFTNLPVKIRIHKSMSADIQKYRKMKKSNEFNL